MSNHQLRSDERVLVTRVSNNLRPSEEIFDVQVQLTDEQRAAVDRAAQHDKEFFEQNPEMAEYLRQPFANEFSSLGIEPVLVLSYRYEGPEGRVRGRVPIQNLALLLKLLSQ